MGASKSPTKKAPAKKTPKAKPAKSKAKTQLAPTLKAAIETPIVTAATCIIDNGGWEVKYGLFSSSSVDNTRPAKMLNCTARPPHQLAVLAGDEIHRMKNLGQLSYQHSLERGMVVDGSTQCAVWSRVLNVCGVNVLPTALAMNKVTGKRPSVAASMGSNNVMIVLLEPPFVPSVISEGVDRMLFRELGVGRVVKLLGGCMAAVKYLKDCSKSDALCINEDMQIDNGSGENKESKWIDDRTQCCCVVDSGHSFTHVIPSQSGAAVVRNILAMVQLAVHLLPHQCILMFIGKCHTKA